METGEIREKPNASASKNGQRIAVKLLVGVLIGAFASGLGFSVPVVGVFAIFAMFLCVLLGLIIYARFDIAGLGAYILTLEVCFVFIGGIMLASAMMLSVTLPLAIMVIMDMRRTRFFTKLYLSLAIELIGMVAALGLIVLVYKDNLGNLTTVALKSSFDEIGQSTKDALVSYYKTLYSALGVALKYETGEELLEAVAVTCGDYVRLELPSMLIVMASINVLPGVKAMSSIRAKRGFVNETNEPLSKLRMPEQFVIGLILLNVTGFILYKTINTSGETVLNTALTLLVVACVVQTIASVSDRFSKAPPVSRGFKAALIVMLILFCSQLIPYYGTLSMLFGSQGLITKFIKRRNANRPDSDGPF